MNDNPYLNDADDSDLFEEENPKEEKKRYVLRGPDGQELPPELQEKLSQYLDTYWDGMGGNAISTIPSEFLAMGQLFSFFSQFVSYRETGALVLAVAEVLDEITDGKVTKTHKFHEAQRSILFTHSNLKVINMLIETLTPSSGSDGSSWHWAELKLYLETYGDLVKFVQTKAQNTYLAMANELGKEVDQQFLDGGTKTSRTSLENITLGHPGADDHVD